MSDMGAVFHVIKDGTQYNAHAYTTLDECPYPNLKVKTRSGEQGYVKLVANGQGDVPFRVKPKSEDTTYQVMSEAVPTGSVILKYSKNYQTFTVPSLVKVVIVAWHDEYGKVVGVTPGKTYKLKCKMAGADDDKAVIISSSNVYWANDNGLTNGNWFRISWSPAINTYTPTKTDY